MCYGCSTCAYFCWPVFTVHFELYVFQYIVLWCGIWFLPTELLPELNSADMGMSSLRPHSFLLYGLICRYPSFCSRTICEVCYNIFHAFSHPDVAMHGHQGFLKCHYAHVTIILIVFDFKKISNSSVDCSW